jgi:hypothetical protein
MISEMKATGVRGSHTKNRMTFVGWPKMGNVRSLDMRRLGVHLSFYKYVVDEKRIERGMNLPLLELFIDGLLLTNS